MASLSELEARVAALEADRADYRAVLAAVGVVGERVDGLSERVNHANVEIEALGEKLSGFQVEVRERFDMINRNREDDRAEFAAIRRSFEDSQAELKGLIVQALDRRTDQ